MPAGPVASARRPDWAQANIVPCRCRPGQRLVVRAGCQVRHNLLVTPNDSSTICARRRAALAAMVLGASALGGACQPARRMAVATRVWVGYETLYLARDRGWLDPTQVELVSANGSADSLQALRSNRVQAAGLTLDEALLAHAGGVPLSILMVFDISLGADMLVAQPHVRDLGDLRGRQIGYETGSVGELMLTEALRAAGLRRSDVRLLQVPVIGQAAAWRARVVDALITFEPMATRLLAMGARRLFDSRQIPDTIVDVLAVRQDALGWSQRSVWQHVIEGHFRAVEHLTLNPHDAAQRMATHLELPASQVLSAYRGLALPDLAQNRRLLSGPTPRLLESARKVAAVLSETGSLVPSQSWTGLIRDDFLPTGGRTP